MAEPTTTQTDKAFGKTTKDHTHSSGGLLHSFSLVHLQFCTIIIILGASSLVPLENLVCAFLASIYIFVMSRFVFPPVTTECPPPMFDGGILFQAYITLAAAVGLYLPLGYILLGVTMGNKKAVQAAAPHTFLLACQVLSEQLTFTSHAISLPVRALVPILYNGGRLVSIWSWILTDFSKNGYLVSIWSWILTDFSKNGYEVSVLHRHVSLIGNWVFFGRALAVANMLLWSYNLFCFLVPMYLPRCFHRYFEDKATQSKKSQ